MSGDTHRQVSLERAGRGQYTVTNARGGQITVGTAAEGTSHFTPVELLLAAIGGCTAVDVDFVTARRAEPDKFEIEIGGESVRDDHGNHVTDITVTFRVAFGDGADGDKAREILPDIVQKSHDRLCTVSRTVELGTTVTPRIE